MRTTDDLFVWGCAGPGSVHRWPTYYRCQNCGRYEHASTCIDPIEGTVDCSCGYDELDRCCDKCWASVTDPACYCVDNFSSTDDPGCEHCAGRGICPHAGIAA